MPRQYLPGLVGLALAVVTGCHTLQPVHPMPVSEVTPDRYERVILDQLFILADSSGSMQEQSRFPEKKAFLQAFMTAMPGGTYEVSVGNFGGPQPINWNILPIDRFDRAPLEHFADHLTMIGGTTDMHLWLRAWEPDISVRDGRAAVLILSDGRAPLVDTMLAARALAHAHQGELCIFAVQFGDDPEGAWLLRELTRIARCGEVWTHEQVNTPGGLEAMIRRIFFQGLLDSDGDGVPDIYDECPDTPRGARVDERGCWVLDGVLFDYDRAEVKPEFNEIIDEVALVLQLNPAVRVRLEGHTDSRGSQAYNQRLSERRAASVKQALVDRGSAAIRIESIGYGKLRPIRPNDSEANMAKNRRVEITPIL
jgi:OOP family OmpA-OmpF porin